MNKINLEIHSINGRVVYDIKRLVEDFLIFIEQFEGVLEIITDFCNRFLQSCTRLQLINRTMA